MPPGVSVISRYKPLENVPKKKVSTSLQSGQQQMLLIYPSYI